jgi:hypothetical protein
MSEFWNTKTSKDGKQIYCIECSKTINKDQRKRMKEAPQLIKRTFKTCNMCDSAKPISQFGKNSITPDKHMNTCKPCWTRYIIRIKNKKVI